MAGYRRIDLQHASDRLIVEATTAMLDKRIYMQHDARCWNLMAMERVDVSPQANLDDR